MKQTNKWSAHELSFRFKKYNSFSKNRHLGHLRFSIESTHTYGLFIQFHGVRLSRRLSLAEKTVKKSVPYSSRYCTVLHLAWEFTGSESDQELLELDERSAAREEGDLRQEPRTWKRRSRDCGVWQLLKTIWGHCQTQCQGGCRLSLTREERWQSIEYRG